MSELNARGEHAVWLLDALIDIFDDEQNNAPEDRCYVEGAWTVHLADIRAFLRGPSNVPDCNGSHDYGAIAAGEQACTACCPDETQPVERKAFEEWMKSIGSSDANLERWDRNEDQYGSQAAQAAWEGWQARAAQPRFPETFCSSCGKALGPGDAGVSHCGDHT